MAAQVSQVGIGFGNAPIGGNIVASLFQPAGILRFEHCYGHTGGAVLVSSGGVPRQQETGHGSDRFKTGVNPRQAA